MSVVPPPASESPGAVPSVPIWRLRVDQYREMIRRGILTEDDPVELLDGWLVTKMPKSPLHAVVTEAGREALSRALPRGWHVRVQDPLTLADSEPEPDLAVVRGGRNEYLRRHPGPGDVALVVEVSDSTLSRDRGLKREVYARSAIPVYWIVDLVEGRVEVFAGPSGPAERPGYRERQSYGRGEVVAWDVSGVEVRVPVADLLPTEADGL